MRRSEDRGGEKDRRLFPRPQPRPERDDDGYGGAEHGEQLNPRRQPLPARRAAPRRYRRCGPTCGRYSIHFSLGLTKFSMISGNQRSQRSHPKINPLAIIMASADTPDASNARHCPAAIKAIGTRTQNWGLKVSSPSTSPPR